MKDIIVFENPEFGAIRTVELDGEPWLVGKDVAAALGYKNPQEAIRAHVDDEDKGVSEILTPGGKQTVPIINESGLYSLVLSSKLPGAKTFRRWVTSEVLPSIRKTGGYIEGQNEMSEAELMAKALLVAHKQLKERDKALAEARPKVVYYDKLVSIDHLTGIRDCAKEFGLGQKEFVELLFEHGFCYRDKTKSKNIRPYIQYVNDGLFVLKDFRTDADFAGVRTLITPKGKSVLYAAFRI